jgi:hypothetical protein
MDTTYEPARLSLAILYLNLLEWDTADSLVQLSERNQWRLGPFAMLDWARAGWRSAAAYRLVKPSEVDPGPNARTLARYQLNRPTEALEILAVDPRRAAGGNWTSGSVAVPTNAGWHDQACAAHAAQWHLMLRPVA